MEKINIQVKHYGPGVVPDPDHSTAVITQGGIAFGTIALNSHEELDELIDALIRARDECEGHFEKPEDPEGPAWPGVINNWPLRGDSE